jgi:L,D-transpeptidase-like protein
VRRSDRCGGGSSPSTPLLAVTVAAALLIWLAPGSHAAAAPYRGPVSNERTTTYWAYASLPGPVRAHPWASAKRTDRLRMWTEVHYPEVYVVLSEVVDPRRTWFKVRLPDRPNGRTGWVSEGELATLHVVHTHLVLDEHALRLTLYRRGRRIFSARVGIGKPSTPTPRGHFWVTEKFRAQGGIYGPYAFGTSDNSVLTDWPGGGVIGIHGTNEPSLIPGRPSHGCIRLRNADDVKLWPLLPVGTPLTIR